jgi:hypothetical protein
MTPSEMLMSLSCIWKSVVEEYPEAEHGEILGHVEVLQSLIFKLRGGEGGQEKEINSEAKTICEGISD